MAKNMQELSVRDVSTKARISTIRLKNFLSQVNKESIDLCNLFDKRHADLMKLNRECTAIANEGERQKVPVSFNGDTQHRIRETKRSINAAIECLLKMHKSLEDTEEALVNSQELKKIQTCLQANKGACPRTPVTVTKEASSESRVPEIHAIPDVEGVQQQAEEIRLAGHPEDVQRRDHAGRERPSAMQGIDEFDSGIGSTGSEICQPQSTSLDHDLHPTVKSE
ncbi:hypothetical protein CHS0354_005728 [Potamilus streckersoni]|uniref:Uncharacterized protein n=1 Tax=Potamilus streckersoni TaxID=2493646 RepID=A0AAE0RW53_9BIVA|nr:hypothetical protein CHS0354_005728 [Potamilus streckersoni]